MPDIQPPFDGQEPQKSLPPSAKQVLDQARALFEAGKVAWKWHSDQERMPERGFDFYDVEHVVLNGYVPDGRAVPGRKPGEWKIKIVDELEGTRRKMGVVCVVADQRLLIILTTEWEDR